MIYHQFFLIAVSFPHLILFGLCFQQGDDVIWEPTDAKISNTSETFHHHAYFPLLDHWKYIDLTSKQNSNSMAALAIGFLGDFIEAEVLTYFKKMCPLQLSKSILVVDPIDRTKLSKSEVSMLLRLMTLPINTFRFY